MQINPWLWYMNWPYLHVSFTMWKGVCSWEKAEKMGNLGNFHVQSQILTGKTRDTTKQLCENQTLAHRRHQLAISVFLIHHVQGYIFLRKHGINREFVKFWCLSPILTGHDTNTPLCENHQLIQQHQLAISMFLIHCVQVSFVLRKRGKSRSFVKFWCVKPNLDSQTAWYYHITLFKSTLDYDSSIFHKNR
jgi:hypothetical protein